MACPDDRKNRRPTSAACTTGARAVTPVVATGADVALAGYKLIRRYTRAVFDEGDVAAVDECLATDFYNHVSGESGTEDFKQLANDVGQAPGNANIIDLLVAEGEFVAAYVTITRTLHKELHVFGLTIPGDG